MSKKLRDVATIQNYTTQQLGETVQDLLFALQCSAQRFCRMTPEPATRIAWMPGGEADYVLAEMLGVTGDEMATRARFEDGTWAELGVSDHNSAALHLIRRARKRWEVERARPTPSEGSSWGCAATWRDRCRRSAPRRDTVGLRAGPEGLQGH